MDSVNRREAMKRIPVLGLAAAGGISVGASARAAPSDRPASEVEITLLRTMKLLGDQGDEGFRKCAAVLTQALKAAGKWRDAAYRAVCLDGCEEPETKRFYDSIGQLIREGFAEGRGNLDLENFSLSAGPRYTECRITLAGLKLLQRTEGLKFP